MAAREDGTWLHWFYDAQNIGFKAKSHPYLKLRAKLLNHLEVRTLFYFGLLQDTMNSVRTSVDIIMEN